MGSLPDTACYRRTDGFVTRAIAGETVLVPIRQQIGDLESIYTMNEVATFIWERLAEATTVGQIAAALEQAFEGEPAEMRRDLEELLEQLLSLRAIEPSHAQPGAPDSIPQQ